MPEGTAMVAKGLFKVGDVVSIPLVSTAAGGVRVGPGPGKEGRIELDMGDRWLVRLTDPIGDTETVEVDKIDMPIEHGGMPRPVSA
jgi:hypothetical protein